MSCFVSHSEPLHISWNDSYSMSASDLDIKWYLMKRVPMDMWRDW